MRGSLFLGVRLAILALAAFTTPAFATIQAATASISDFTPASKIYHCDDSLMVNGSNVLAKLRTLQVWCAKVTPFDPSEKPWDDCALYINGKDSTDDATSIGLPDGKWNVTVAGQKVEITVELETLSQAQAMVYVKQTGLGHDFWNLPTDVDQRFFCQP